MYTCSMPQVIYETTKYRIVETSKGPCIERAGTDAMGEVSWVAMTAPPDDAEPLLSYVWAGALSRTMVAIAEIGKVSLSGAYGNQPQLSVEFMVCGSCHELELSANEFSQPIPCPHPDKEYSAVRCFTDDTLERVLTRAAVHFRASV